MTAAFDMPHQIALPESMPSLHEIAAMPFPASEMALERWYGIKPRSGEEPAPDGLLRKFKVEVEYSYLCTEYESVTVTAATEDEAKDMAEEATRETFSSYEEFSILDTSIIREMPL